MKRFRQYVLLSIHFQLPNDESYINHTSSERFMFVKIKHCRRRSREIRLSVLSAGESWFGGHTDGGALAVKVEHLGYTRFLYRSMSRHFTY